MFMDKIKYAEEIVFINVLYYGNAEVFEKEYIVYANYKVTNLSHTVWCAKFNISIIFNFTYEYIILTAF